MDQDISHEENLRRWQSLDMLRQNLARMMFDTGLEWHSGDKYVTLKIRRVREEEVR